jgi:hypothetical protein
MSMRAGAAVGDPTVERITEALAAAIREGELADDGAKTGMPGAWVIVGLWHDADGAERTLFLGPDDQSVHTTLGLLDAGQVVYREQLRQWVFDGGPKP